jgi:hypothetical protein
VEYNECKTCKAGNGRAGLLINDECLNCNHTRKKGVFTLHTDLSRTEKEIGFTFAIINLAPQQENRR